ncbi:protein phosphatase 1 regulatory subunit 16A-like isoform X2 [Brevipalpus obovatus]|uniref:protein phosphatase 1 regulatory subunit 16A-like isoform X2 n=1 Tax=Brevipalpus obovatus TaxID=246614 RepID=UPI003D9E205F
MCEHADLVAEMSLLEKMSTQDRLKLARKRRMQQLKKWNQREKDSNYKKKSIESSKRRGHNGDYKVHFVPSVMLLEAAARNDIEEGLLLMLGVSPDSTNEDGLTALHQCCIDDSEEMLKLLIDFGANINAKDSEKWTPLHAAATCGLLHLVKYLIAKGADLLAVNADGNMPYDICEDEATLDYIESEMAKRGITQEMIDETRASVENRMLADLKQIAELGGDLECRDNQGATPLHVAAANGYSVVVEFLLDNHVSTDVVDNDQWQPIHAAACWGHPDVLELLVQAGADLNARTKSGETPLEICEDPELKERIVQLRSEMETKRNSTHSLRLKRSHSQNTRSQSVRRTSIREKSQISRREAREEARLRQEKTQNGDEIDGDPDVGKALKNDSNLNDNCINMESNIGLVTASENGVIDCRIGELKLNGDSSSHNLPPPSYDDSLAAAKSNSSIISTNSSIHLNASSLSSSGTIGTSSCQADQASTSSSSLTSSLIKYHNDYQIRPSISSSNSSSGGKDAIVIKNEGFSDKDAGRGGGGNLEVANSSADLDLPVSINDSCISQQGSNKSVARGINTPSAESVKVEIHVTVNATPSFETATGTLADLKKHRANLRHRNSLSSLETPGISPAGNSGSNVIYEKSTDEETSANNVRRFKTAPNLMKPTPSLPNSSMRKFRADPSEVVGETTQSKGCCKLM